jgi:hypothetical protein
MLAEREGMKQGLRGEIRQSRMKSLRDEIQASLDEVSRGEMKTREARCQCSQSEEGGAKQKTQETDKISCVLTINIYKISS